MGKKKEDLIKDNQYLTDRVNRLERDYRLLESEKDKIESNSKLLQEECDDLKNEIHFLAGMLVDKGVRIDKWAGFLNVKVVYPEEKNTTASELVSF